MIDSIIILDTSARDSIKAVPGFIADNTMVGSYITRYHYKNDIIICSVVSEFVIRSLRVP